MARKKPATAAPKTEQAQQVVHTYDTPQRRIEAVTVDKRNLTDDSFSVVWSNGWSYLIPREHEKHFQRGTHVLVESINFSHIVGLRVNGAWVFRHSDQDLAAAAERQRADTLRREEEALEENRADWTARTAALPDWLRGRLQAFIDDPEKGEEFQRSSWHYELGASELAALYETHPAGDDAPEVNEYAQKHGTTGYMHSWAAAAATRHGRDVADAASSTEEE
jgi:hypothetical protein